MAFSSVQLQTRQGESVAQRIGRSFRGAKPSGQLASEAPSKAHPELALTSTSASGIATQQQTSGWYYCWNRMYDPLIGRWTSPDPAAEPWENLHDFALAKPLSFSDSSGLSTYDSANEIDPMEVGSHDLTKYDARAFSVKNGTFTWENTSRTAMAQGNYVFWGQAKFGFKVTFSPNDSCPECDPIKMVQMVRMKHDGTVETDYSGGYNKSVHFDDEGWLIDTNVEGSPYPSTASDGGRGNGYKSDASIEDEAGSSNKHYLAFYDAVEMEFVTCAFCPNQGIFLGCVKFSIMFDTLSKNYRLVSPRLHTRPFIRSEDASWWNNDKTRKKWNSEETKKLRDAK